MSIFHETMREILEDVQKFLNLTLQREHLTAASISHKESLLMKIHRLRTEYPQLHLQLIRESSANPGCVVNSEGQDNLQQQSLANNSNNSATGGHHVSPPPYIDMQGNSIDADYVYSDTATGGDEYEICDYEGQYRDGKAMSEECDSSNHYKEPEFPSIPANELTNVIRCGYLEKKGKDRLGGWLNLFQKRFVALKDDILYLYNKNSDKKPYCLLPLRGYDIRTAGSSAAKDGGKKEACFELVGPGKKTYQFVAASSTDARQWIEAVQKVMATIPTESSIPPLSTGAVDTCVVPTNAGSATSDATEVNSNESREDIYEVVEDAMTARDSSTTLMATSTVPDIEEELYGDAAANEPENDVPNTIAITAAGDFVDVDDPLDWYVGLWDCASSVADELEFKRGDLVRIINKDFDDCRWWVAAALDGQIGLVPKEYLMRAYESVDVTTRVT